RDIEHEAKDEGETRARKIVTLAIQRVASEQTAESVVSVLHLPSDDMKGRIIGREGRNIRAFESTTGVNLIIDDTPEAVLLSCFDPVRREVGKALTREVEGSHAIIGAEIARKYGEHEDVVHAIEAHHNEVEVRTVEAVLTQAADGISGGRPGARRESLEHYVKRLERIEE